MTCQDFLTLPLNGVKWPQHRPIIWLTFDKQINSVPRHVANKALKSRHHNFYDLISNICVYLFQSSACGQCQQHSHNNTKWNWRCKAAVQSAHMVKKCGNQLLLRVFNFVDLTLCFCCCLCSPSVILQCRHVLPTRHIQRHSTPNWVSFLLEDFWLIWHCSFSLLEFKRGKKSGQKKLI